LVGGDLLPRFPLRTENGRVFSRRDAARSRGMSGRNPRGLAAGVSGCRPANAWCEETARLVRLGADPADAVRGGDKLVQRTPRVWRDHAIAGSPDCLRLHDDPATDRDDKLAAIGEILGHIADDVRGERFFPFHAGSKAME